MLPSQDTANISPVTSIAGVPLHRLPKSLLPCCALRPSQPPHLLTVHKVPLVIERPVLHEPDGLLGVHPKNLTYVPGHIHHSPLLSRGNVIHMPNLTSVKNNIKGFSNILTVQVAPGIQAIPINREWQASHCQESKFGDELLGELIWPIHIVTSRGDHRKIIGPCVGHHQHLCPGFRSRIRVCRKQPRFLMVTKNSIEISFSVDFIGADMNEPSDLNLLACLEEDVGTVHIVFGELEGTAEGVVDVSLGGKVHDGIDRLGDQEVVHQVGTGDVAPDKLEIRGSTRRVEVFKAGAVVDPVEDDDVVARVIPDQTVCHVGRDETRGTSYEDVLGLIGCHLEWLDIPTKSNN
ncbi:hypothetical protein ACQJBY_003216 [Aegilops geniculata]